MNNIKIDIPIIENYKNYTPPSFVLNSINRLLSGTEQKYLVGLKSIILTNADAMGSYRRKNEAKMRNRGKRTLAFYSPKAKSKPAYILV